MKKFITILCLCMLVRVTWSEKIKDGHWYDNYHTASGTVSGVENGFVLVKRDDTGIIEKIAVYNLTITGTENGD